MLYELGIYENCNEFFNKAIPYRTLLRTEKWLSNSLLHMLNKFILYYWGSGDTRKISVFCPYKVTKLQSSPIGYNYQHNVWRLLWCSDLETKEKITVVIRELEELGEGCKNTRLFWMRRIRGKAFWWHKHKLTYIVMESMGVSRRQGITEWG